MLTCGPGANRAVACNADGAHVELEGVGTGSFGFAAAGVPGTCRRSFLRRGGFGCEGTSNSSWSERTSIGLST